MITLLVGAIGFLFGCLAMLVILMIRGKGAKAWAEQQKVQHDEIVIVLQDIEMAIRGDLRRFAG